jgi:hypothetical protein
MFRSWLRRPPSDSGIGMVLVIGTTTVLMLFVATTLKIGIDSLRSSRTHVQFEDALGVVETGIDQTLTRLQANSAYTACGCTAPSFATDTDERNWAKTTIKNLATNNPSLIQNAPGGQFLAIRPGNKQTVYAMGWVPSYSAAVKTRLLKAEYLFGPYKPGNALLTSGDLNFSGSVTINTADPATSSPVHTNGSVTSNNSSLTIVGDLTSSGSYNVGSGANIGSGSAGGQPLEVVPTLNPRDVYANVATDATLATYKANWYDLCPDGKVRSMSSSGVPCSGGLVQDASTTMFYGWQYTAGTGSVPPVWTMSMSDNTPPAVYYVYQGNAVISGQSGSTPWTGTVLAEAANQTTCNKFGGDITWKLTDIANYLPGIVFLAGADLYDQANNNAADGMFGAADQVYFQTSSASLKGWVVASDQCPNPGAPSSVQGVTISYDQNTEAPIKSVIRTTLWLEYVG